MRKCRFCEKPIQDASRVCEHCGKDLVPRAATPRHDDAIDDAPDPDLSTAPIARVSVVNVDMPFESMVGFMVKWALASIPAFLILFVIFFVVAATLGGWAAGCRQVVGR